MTLKPLGGRVIVKRREQSDRTDSGLYLPDVAKEEQLNEGRIVAVAADSELEPGTICVFGRYSGNDVEIGGVEHVILDGEDILALVEGED